MSMRTRDRRRRERQRITMVEFKWIQMSLFLIALLHFTAAAEKLLSVRVGGDVTLPCDNVIDGQQRCENTTWLFSASGNTAAVALFELGQIKNTNSKSDRLSVTENCSLVIKKVTVEDVGRYTCRQFNGTGPQQGPDSQVDLSVITSEHTITTTTTTTTTDNASTELKGWWWVFLIVAVVLAALLIIVVKVIRWKRTKGKKTRMNDNVGLTSNPAVTQSAPETSQDTADPEDGVSYASISFTKKTNSKGRVRDREDDDDDEAVTYVTVKASSSSAGASANPSNLYATVNKPNK